MKTWEEVWTALTRVDVYSKAATVKIKKQILQSVWKEDAPRLVELYDQGGMGSDGAIGFGFLVEAFVKKSPRVPRNTEAGERLANLLTRVLHSGDSEVGIGRRLYNPDFIWAENAGRRSVITGIGEIKSSVEALAEKLQQITNFESGLRLVLKKIQSDKEAKRAIPYLTLKRVVLAEPLKRVLFLPAFESTKIRWLPDGWEVLEMEFSYNELVFIAREIWPKFRPDFRPEEGYLPKYEREFLAKLEEWGRVRFAKIFAGTALKPFPAWEYLLYAFATGELPLSDGEVKLAVECVRESDPTPSLPPRLVDPASPSTWERKFTEYFVLLWGKEVKEYAVHFLHDRRSFVARLEKILRRRDIKAALRKGVVAFDLLDT